VAQDTTTQLDSLLPSVLLLVLLLLHLSRAQSVVHQEQDQNLTTSKLNKWLKSQLPTLPSDIANKFEAHSFPKKVYFDVFCTKRKLAICKILFANFSP
jgi:hypothetical protein